HPRRDPQAALAHQEALRREHHLGVARGGASRDLRRREGAAFDSLLGRSQAVRRQAARHGDQAGDPVRLRGRGEGRRGRPRRHGKGTTARSIVLPGVADAVKPLPVIAAGGVADGRGLAAALQLGAQAVSIGTRFLCSRESAALRAYKERIVRAKAEDTVHTLLFDIGWPDAAHRGLRNQADDEWEGAGPPPTGRRPGGGVKFGEMSVAGPRIEMPRYHIFPPLEGFEGDIEYAALYAGQSCALVNDIKPAAEIIRHLV